MTFGLPPGKLSGERVEELMMSPWGLAILGVVLLVLGLILGVGLLWTIGLVCLVVGLIWGVATSFSRGPRTPI